MKQLLSTFFACVIFLPAMSQTIVFKNPERVTPKTYNKIIGESFSYLLLGENSPTTGISTTLKEDGTNIKISGNLMAKKWGILSVEADLSADNGIYFIDQEEGSEQGKFTLNFNTRIGYKISSYSEKNQRNIISKNLKILDKITRAKSKYLGLKAILNSMKEQDRSLKSLMHSIQDNNDNQENSQKRDDNKYEEKLKELVKYYINDEGSTYNQVLKSLFDESEYKLKEKHKGYNTVYLRNTELTIPKDYDYVKVLEDFNEVCNYIEKDLEEDIAQIETENIGPRMAATHIWFLGISPYYERETATSFELDGTKKFSDMLTDNKGDLYGLKVSINYSMQKNKGSKNWIKPELFFGRISLSTGRTSNISSLRNKNLTLSSSLGSDIDGDTIYYSNVRKAYIGDKPYEYGSSYKLGMEAYCYPVRPIKWFGLFIRTGYEHIDFSSMEDKKLTPFRTGALFNIKNSDAKKPSLIIQAFLDWRDINLDTGEESEDPRFGIGIGMPINIK